jgi:hypothetical protein
MVPVGIAARIFSPAPNFIAQDSGKGGICFNPGYSTRKTVNIGRNPAEAWLGPGFRS